MKKNLLFLCTGNTCRSQMAEGILRDGYNNNFEVYSAGSQPSQTVNPHAIKVMHEIGIDISHQKPKHFNDLPQIEFDYVITLCDHAKTKCPIYKGAKTIHWGLKDPFDFIGSLEDTLKVYRDCRDEIKNKINDFLNKDKS